MFCENCGNQVPEGHRFCSHCGHAMTAPQQQFQPPVQEQQFQPPVQEQQFQPPVQEVQQPRFVPPVEPQYQAPVQPQYQAPVQPQYQAPQQPQYQSWQPYEQPGFAVSMPTPGKRVRKTRKSGKGGLIVAAVLLVAVVAAVVLFWNAISGFALRTFGDPGQYMAFVEKKNADAAIDGVCEVYDTALEDLKKADTLAAEASVKLRPGDTLITLLETLLSQEGVELELDWLKEISLDTDVNTDGGKQAVDLVLGINGTGVLTAKTVQDMEAMQVFLALPELNETWLMGDFADAGVDLTQTQKLPGELAKALPEKAVLEEILGAYTDIVFSNMGDAQKRTETVTVAGLEQEMMILRAEISQREVVELVDAVLQHAEKDEQLLKVLDDLSAVVNDMPDTYEPVDLRQEFLAVVNEGLISVVDARAEATDEIVLYLETYVDDAHRIVGRDIYFPDDATELHYAMVVSGTQFAVEAWAPELSIAGNGSLSKDGVSGSIRVTVEGMQLLTLELEDLQVRDDKLVGTLRVLPDSQLMEDGDEMALLLGGDPSLRLTLDGESVDMAILAGDSELLGVRVQGEETENRPISLPEGMNLEDDAAVEQWLKGLKLDTLVSNLQSAGVPSELTEVISALGQLLAY